MVITMVDLKIYFFIMFIVCFVFWIYHLQFSKNKYSYILSWAFFFLTWAFITLLFVVFPYGL
jgi:hypothetical protein